MPFSVTEFAGFTNIVYVYKKMHKMLVPLTARVKALADFSNKNASSFYLLSYITEAETSRFGFSSQQDYKVQKFEFKLKITKLRNVRSYHRMSKLVYDTLPWLSV